MSEQEILEHAWRRGTQLFGEEKARQVLAQLHGWDPDFALAFQRFVYGGMYDRTVVDAKTRQLLAIAACVVKNALGQLETHTRAALRVGATKEEVMEVILQMSVYIGFPYMLQAARRIEQLFEKLEAEQSAN